VRPVLAVPTLVRSVETDPAGRVGTQVGAEKSLSTSEGALVGHALEHRLLHRGTASEFGVGVVAMAKVKVACANQGAHREGLQEKVTIRPLLDGCVLQAIAASQKAFSAGARVAPEAPQREMKSVPSVRAPLQGLSLQNRAAVRTEIECIVRGARIRKGVPQQATVAGEPLVVHLPLALGRVGR
jgi:hypothetical protein